jgi:hypothetical protein
LIFREKFFRESPDISLGNGWPGIRIRLAPERVRGFFIA